MDFVEVLKRKNRDLYDSSDKSALPKLARFMERAGGMIPLLKAENSILDSFAPVSLSLLGDTFEHYLQWKHTYREIKKILATSKLSIPDKSLQNTAYPHELRALVRIAKMCQRAGHSDLESWTNAVNAHLALWNASLEIAKAKTKASSLIIDKSFDDLDQFTPYTFSNEKLDDLKKYTWMGARRGQKAGALEIKLKLPMAEIEKQAAAHISSLGVAAMGRPLKTVVEELVGNDLGAIIMTYMDKEAQDQALNTARKAYQGLFSVDSIPTEMVFSIYVGGPSSKVGAVLLSKDNEVKDAIEFKAKDSKLIEGLSEMVQELENYTIILPVSAKDQETLRKINDYAISTGMSVAQILPAGISEAREEIKGYPTPLSSAIILARRAISPIEEWGKIAPSVIGLGEFSTFIPPEQLDRALEEVRLLEKYLKKKENPRIKTGQVFVKRRRLNPLVRTIRDLKPGMLVDGIVTNLTKFGAFVNIGLSTEAMIHVSQLSVEFIEEPSQVVSIGQSLSARVIDIIPEKGRIALSLKPASADGASTSIPISRAVKEVQSAKTESNGIFSESEMAKLKAAASTLESKKDRDYGRTPSAGGRVKEQPKKSRSEALADLDALFKK